MSTLRIGAAALAFACAASLATAQTNPPATTTPSATSTPPAATTDTARPADTMAKTTDEKPPIAGANSFTEAQAMDRIAKAGFADVKELKKDDQGIWRGKAQKSGQQVGVALDFRGNVVQQ